LSVDLSVDVCSVHFRNPFVLSSATPTMTALNIKRGIEAGFSGAVMKTLFPAEHSRVYARPRFKVYWLKDQPGYPQKIPRSYTITAIEDASDLNPEDYEKEVNETKKLIGEDGVLVASIMASDMETWEKYMELVNGTKADMVEFNFACPYAGEPGTKEKGPKLGWSLMDMGEEVLRLAKRKLSIPFSPKISSQTGDVANWATKFEASGAPLLTVSHRISGIYIDIETGRPAPFGCMTGFGGPYLIGFSLKWVAKTAPKVKVPIMAGMGVYDWADVVRFLMVGASVVQTCSAVMIQGYDIVKAWSAMMSEFMKAHGYSSIKDMKGIALPYIVPPDKVERGAPGVYAVVDKQKCDGCAICKRSCFHFAIELAAEKVDVDLRKCAGCGLCSELCPKDAISIKKLANMDLYPRSKPYHKYFPYTGPP